MRTPATTGLYRVWSVLAHFILPTTLGARRPELYWKSFSTSVAIGQWEGVWEQEKKENKQDNPLPNPTPPYRLRLQHFRELGNLVKRHLHSSLDAEVLRRGLEKAQVVPKPYDTCKVQFTEEKLKPKPQKFSCILFSESHARSMTPLWNLNWNYITTVEAVSFHSLPPH